MKIIFLHNYYQTPGGEDESFRSESMLLRSHGHHVVSSCAHNASIQTKNLLNVALNTVWNHRTYWSLRRLCKIERPHIIHCQNIFPLLSPSVYYAAKAEGIPVVQTLRNYRLLCPGATLFRQGDICNKCLSHKLLLPALCHRCYRQSFPGSAVVSGMILFHRLLQTWKRKITIYIALTDFSRNLFIQEGFPEDRIYVKPNFLSEDPGIVRKKMRYALFVGRLSPEKGLQTLLDAWKNLGRSLPLKIVGDGPLAPLVRRQEQQNPAVQWLGRQPSETVLDLMGQADFLVFPSLWYETFGRVAIEAFAKGTPVIASNLGAMAEIIRDGRTGLLYRPGDADDLSAVVQWALSHPERLAAMRKAARAEFEAKYTAERNYKMIMDIYQAAIARPRP